MTFETLQQSTSPSRGAPHRHHGPDLFRRESVRPLQVVPQVEDPAVPLPTQRARSDSLVGLQVAYQGVPAMIPPAASSAAVRTWGHRRRESGQRGRADVGAIEFWSKVLFLVTLFGKLAQWRQTLGKTKIIHGNVHSVGY